MKRLRNCYSPYEIKIVMSSPSDIDDLWIKGLISVAERHPKIESFIRNVLRVLSVSARGLTFNELQDGFRWTYASPGNHLVAHELLSMDSTLLTLFKPFQNRERLSSGLDGAVVIELAHPSLKEFLLSDRIASTQAKILGVSEPEANGDMAKSCLTYLLRLTHPIERSRKIIDRYPYLRYAACYWYFHYKQSKGMLADLTILKLFTSEVCFANWLSIYDPDKHEPDASTGKHPSPLYYAALLGLCDVAEALLDQDARLDVHEGELDSPLLAAVHGGYGDIVDLLLNRGDDVNQRSGNGDTPLARAAFFNNVQIVHILLQHGANSAGTNLHWAAANGYEDVLRLLLENGADVNTRDADGRNALYYALFTEDSKRSIAQLLLEAGADIEQLDTDGYRLLHHAAVMSDLENMSLLLDLGASIEVMDGLGKTALHIAARRLHSEGVALLLRLGADPNSRDNFGSTPLHDAILATDDVDPERIYEEQISITISHFLEAGADPRAADFKGLTALQLARQREGQYPAVVKLLTDAEKPMPPISLINKLTLLHEDKTYIIGKSSYPTIARNLSVGALRQVAADAIGMDDAREYVLFFESRELTDDSRDWQGTKG